MIAKLFKGLAKRLVLSARYPNCRFHWPINVSFSSSFENYVVIFENVDLQNSTVGAHSYIQKNSVCLNANIGKFCSIGSNVKIGLPNHPINIVSTSPVFYDPSQPLPKFFTNDILFDSFHKRTTIGSDVWVGDNVLIIEGVSIGTGSVIGAGSIVTNDIPPYSVAFGVPCRVSRLRFDREIIEALLDSEWWNGSDETYKAVSRFASVVDEFVNYMKYSGK